MGSNQTISRHPIVGEQRIYEHRNNGLAGRGDSVQFVQIVQILQRGFLMSTHGKHPKKKKKSKK